jgi:outer membrane protein TolC
MEERRLEAGLTTIPMLLDAQIRLARAQGNYTRAMLDYQLGRAELGFMLGNR